MKTKKTFWICEIVKKAVMCEGYSQSEISVHIVYELLTVLYKKRS